MKRGQTDRQQTDIAITRPDGPSGPIRWKSQFYHFRKWSFVISGHLKNLPKHKMLYVYEVFWSISFIVFHSLTKKTLNTFFKTWAMNLELAEILVFHQKNMVVEFFSGSDKTLKVGKNLWFRCCWLNIFCMGAI